MMSVCACINAHVCWHKCAYVHVDTRSIHWLLHSLSTSLFETGSLTEHGAHHFPRLTCLQIPRDPTACLPSTGTTGVLCHLGSATCALPPGLCFLWMLGILTQVLVLVSKHCTDWAITSAEECILRHQGLISARGGWETSQHLSSRQPSTTIMMTQDADAATDGHRHWCTRTTTGSMTLSFLCFMS